MGAVLDSADFQRVYSLPRRVWNGPHVAQFAREMTNYLRAPGGTWELRPVQAIALHEARMMRGGFFPIRTGGGKTVLSQLLATAVHAARPLVVIPASLKPDFWRAWEVTKTNFRTVPYIEVESYQRLAMTGAADFLETYKPDLIVCDEAQHLRNMDAAATRRITRYITAHPETVFVVMTGTIAKRSLRDFAHLAGLALRSGSPCPLRATEVESWARALDVDTGFQTSALEPGVLLNLGGATPLEGFRSRLTETYGVVATSEEPLPIRLVGKAIMLEAPPRIVEAFAMLRKEGELPDGHTLEMGPQTWQAARQLAAGHYLRWDPWPPDWWTKPRRAWCATARDIVLNQDNGIDTDKQLRDAIDAGRFAWAKPALDAWRAVSALFEPNTVPVWLDYSTISATVERMHKAPAGIVWTDSIAFGEMLSKVSRVPYYAEGGLDASGRFILDHPGGLGHGWAIASIKANATGRNLQAWNHNVIATPTPGGDVWEQMLSRTHRDGQLSDTVTFEVLFGCSEALKVFDTACNDAIFAETLTGQSQKLCHAELIDFPDPYELLGSGPQWAGR